MSFDPAEWLRVAEMCCTKIPGVSQQALLRTAVGRAYYAVLLSLKQQVERVQGPGSVPQEGTHRALLHGVRAAGQDFRRVYEILRRLRHLRNQADYEPASRPFVLSDTIRDVSTSRWLIYQVIRKLPDSAYERIDFTGQN